MTGVDLEPIGGWARAELDRKNAAREQALRWSRELVRTCATSIRAIHRREFSSADVLIAEAHHAASPNVQQESHARGVNDSGPGAEERQEQPRCVTHGPSS